MPRALMFILILLVCNCTAIAQDNPMVITNKWQHVNNDTASIAKAITMYKKISATHPEQASKLLLETLKQSISIQYKQGIYQSLLYIGWIYHTQAKNKEGLYFLHQAIPYAELPENIAMANILYRYVGGCYLMMGNYEQSLKYFYKALEVLDDKKKPQKNTDSSTVYSMVSWAWAQMGELNYAIETSRKGIAIAERRKNIHMLAELYHGLAAFHLEINQPDSAEKYYNQAFVLSDAKNVRCLSLVGLSKVYEKRRNYVEALNYIDQSLLMIDTLFYDRVIIDITAQKASVYLQMKKYAKAEATLAPVMAKAYAMNNKDLFDFLLLTAANVYASNHHYQEAYFHLQNLNQHKQARYNQEKKNFVSVWLNSQTAERDKKILRQRLYIKKQENHLQRTNFWMGISVMGTLLLFSVSFAVVRNYRNKQILQQAQIAQLQQSKEINHLKARMRGEEQERERIARDLHDSVASQLWAIRLGVESMQQKTAAPATAKREKLSTIFYQLNEITQTVRKTAHNLLPDLLLQEGLATAFASFCDRLSKTQKNQIDFQEYGNIPAIDKEIELTIYRIVQELVQHISQKTKHDSPLLVQLSCINDLLSFSIEGEGAENAEPAINTLNTEQLQEKISTIKGNLELKSEPGKPAYAYLEFDLKGFIT